MKKFVLSAITVILISCSTTKKAGVITYLLSSDAEKSIYQELLKSTDTKNIAFYFECMPNSFYKIHLVDANSIKEFNHSNRMLFVNDNFYPIIFNMDYYFYTEMNENYPQIIKVNNENFKETDIRIPGIEERSINRDSYGYPRKTHIIDFSVYWIINSKGELIETNAAPLK